MQRLPWAQLFVIVYEHFHGIYWHFSWDIAKCESLSYERESLSYNALATPPNASQAYVCTHTHAHCAYKCFLFTFDLCRKLGS